MKTLINEEALLFAKYLRGEIRIWMALMKALYLSHAINFYMKVDVDYEVDED